MSPKLPLLVICFIFVSGASLDCQNNPYSKTCRFRALYGTPPAHKINSETKRTTNIYQDQGGLINVTMNSKVGVLLDEISPSSLQSVKIGLMGKSDAWWKVRVIRQLAMTSYRLSFRNYFYEDDDGNYSKFQLPLPSFDQFNIKFTTPPTLCLINTHLHLARNYQFTTTILTDAYTPSLSDDLLGVVGGVTIETFNLPVDPELIFQRTGYACMDESEFPMNSVEQEYVDYFFDDTCMPEPPYSFMNSTTLFCEQCHCSNVVTESCVDALQRVVGAVVTNMVFTRIAWDPLLAMAVRMLSPTKVLNPSVGSDLTSLRNINLIYWRPERVTYRFFTPDMCEVNGLDKCVNGVGWRRILFFDTIDTNIGTSAIYVGEELDYEKFDPPPFLQHNLLEWAPCHEHYHFSHYVDYNFNSQIGLKRGFCLESVNRRINQEWSPLVHGFNCANQGIQDGWEDVYQQGIPCQWLDVTSINTKTEPFSGNLTLSSNPEDLICEGILNLDQSGNYIWVNTSSTTTTGLPIEKMSCTLNQQSLHNNNVTYLVTIPLDGNGLITARCPRPGQQIGPLRDCDFQLLSVYQNCTVGQNVVLTCNVSLPAYDQVIRVCEYSYALQTGVACQYTDAISNTVLEIATKQFSFSFLCPSGRSTVEIGGAYSLYIASVFVDNPIATVNCNANLDI